MTPAQIRSALYCALITESINKATARASRMRPSTVLAGHGAGASCPFFDTLLAAERLLTEAGDEKA